MKKRILFMGAIALSALTFAQTGVGVMTENPQGIFHVDAAGDNPATGMPNDAQQINDVIVDNTGRVGIGYVAPRAKLEVYGDIGLSSGGGIGSNLRAKLEGLYTGGGSGYGGSLLFSTKSHDNIWAEHMRITDTGNVGIGTAAPQTTLDVAAPSLPNGQYNRIVKIGRAGDEVFGGSIGSRTLGSDQRQGLMIRSHQTLTLQGDVSNDSNGPVLDILGASSASVADDSNLLMRVMNTGNVGIGTTDPTTKLQVVGLAEYADNAAALAAGLTAGAFYRTGDLLKVVH